MNEEYSSMRSSMIRISAENIIKKEYKALDLKPGDVFHLEEEDILDILIDWSLDKDFSFYLIKHDNDPDNVHYHLVLQFNHPTKFSTIKRKFPFGKIDKCKYGVKACVQYLVHMNNPEKHPYSWDDVITNNETRLENYKLPKGQTEKEKIEEILKKIATGEIKEYEIAKIDYRLYIKYASKIKKAFEYRQVIVANNPNRNLQVIVCQGPSRVGKSLFAKIYAEKNDKSICFSSSSNDPWQEYLGQDIFVYDDLDYSSNKIEDLLKAFDPHNLTSISARYKNRLFVGDTIFVCTNTNIADWYTWESDEHRKAFFARISCVLKFSKVDEGISSYTVNNIVNSGEWDFVKDSWGSITNRKYSIMKFNPLDDKVREFNLNNYVDINADKIKTDNFISQLDNI